MGATYVILGAGHAGTAAAAAMRSAGFAGRIVLVGDDPHLPYERPALSKGALLEGVDTVPVIYPAEFYSAQGIELKLGSPVVALDRTARSVTLANGEVLAYDKLLIATGASARRYPLLDALGDRVHVVRTLDDAKALRSELQAGRRLLIVGGGVIGLEVAATAVQLGLSVTVLERAPRLLARGTPQGLADILLDAHAAHGVSIEVSVELSEARVEDGVVALTARDGRRFAGDLIVYGIGVTLNDALASAVGLACDDGIVVDALGCTSDPAIFAAGDIARQHHGFLDAEVRHETWANALHQGAAAGRAMVTGEPTAEDVPWFWTDQFGVNYQVAGRIEADRWIVRDGPVAGRCMHFGLTGGVLTGAVGVDAGADMRVARKLIAARAMPDPDALADPQQTLRKINSMPSPA